MRPGHRAFAAVVTVGAALALWVSLRPGAPPALAQTPAPSPTPADVETLPGRGLYLRDCSWCHGSQGEGTTFGPTLVGVGSASSDFMLRTGRMPIPTPEEQPGRAEVPYTEQEIADLVSFVESFGEGEGPAIPSVDVAAGELVEGAVLYEENCAACHGALGSGGALTNGLIAPALRDSTPVEVAEAIRIGGAGFLSGNMPRFGPETLTDEQVDSITRYVQYLREPDDRGGHDLGHFGPIPEGFVAWAVGLLALVLAIRWIGTSD
jgi:ubiquinol-cytochrome c reductase cytochrome c subunit